MPNCIIMNRNPRGRDSLLNSTLVPSEELAFMQRTWRIDTLRTRPTIPI